MLAVAYCAYDGFLPAVQAKYMSTAYSGRTAMSARNASARLCGMSIWAASAAQERRTAAPKMPMPERMAAHRCETWTPLNRMTTHCSATALASTIQRTCLVVLCSVIGSRFVGGDRRVQAALAPAPGVDGREDEEEERQQGDDGRDGPPQEDEERALRHDQALSQRALGHIAEHQREHQRSQGVVELLEDVSDHAEQDHVPDVDHVVVRGVRADGADQHDERREDGEGDAEDGREERHEGQHHHHADQVAGVHAGDQPPDELGLFLE